MTTTTNSAYTFKATSGIQQITTSGKNIGRITQYGIGGTSQLQDDYTGTLLDVEFGTFDANGKNITCFSVYSSYTSIRTITMGSGTWELTGSGTVFDISAVTNLTFNCNTSTIKLTNNSSSNKYFGAGGHTYYNFWNATLGTGICSILSHNTFNNFKIDAGRTTDFQGAETTTISSLTAP